MSKVLRLAGWLLLALLIVLLALLLLIRFRPDAAVWAANQALNDVELTAVDAEVQYLPPRLRLTSFTARTSEQTINASVIDAAVDVRAWRSGAPFWQASADRILITPRNDPAPAPEPASAVNLALPDLANLFTFLRLRIGELVVEGPNGLTAKLEAEREAAHSKLKADFQQGNAQISLQGTVESASNQPLGFDFALTSLPVNATEEATKITANITGTLASGPGGTRLAIASGNADLARGDQQQSLNALKGTLTIPAAGDSLSLEDLMANLNSPVDQLSNLPIAVSGTARFSPTSTQLDLNGSAGETAFSTATVVNADGTAAAGKLTLTSKGLPAGIPTAPYTAAEIFPASLSSDFELAANSVRLNNLRLDTPTNQLTATASVKTASPWMLVADIQADQLYVPLVGSAPEDSGVQESQAPAADLNQPAGAESAPGATAAAPGQTAEVMAATEADGATRQRLFTDATIDWSWLSTAEVDLKLAAKQFALQDASFNDLQLLLTNDNATLTLDPLSASIDSGGFSGTAVVSLASAAQAPLAEQDETQESAQPPERDAETLEASFATAATAATAARPVAVKANFLVDGVSLERFGLLPPEELSGGKIEANIQLTTKGNSSAELAGGLNGEILLIVEEAKLMNDYIELAGSDLLMETLNKLNPFAKDDPTTELNCALVRFTAEDGTLTTRNQLVMETSKMEIVGNGNIDLNTEKISLGITPNAKSGVGINVGSAVKFMKLGGTLANPRPAVSAGGLLKSGLAIGAAISTGGASVVAEGLAKRALNAGSACVAARDAQAEAVESPSPAPGEE